MTNKPVNRAKVMNIQYGFLSKGVYVFLKNVYINLRFSFNL